MLFCFQPAESTEFRSCGAEQWPQRHPEAGLSWPSWPKASQKLSGMRLLELNVPFPGVGLEPLLPRELLQRLALSRHLPQREMRSVALQ